MKLVDILARELKGWPESWGIYCVSSKVDGAFAAWFGCRNPVFEDGGWSDIGTVELWLSEDPEDRKKVVVRRFEWQAAVDALKAEVRPTESMALYHQEVGRITRQWSGEGLPPVGTVCECHLPGELTNNYSWVEAKVIWHNGPTECAVVRSTSKLAWCDEFRPIRTPEQIAAEERKKSINAMFDIFEGFPGDCMASLGALYDAGYRKFEIVDN